ncbi:MAG: DPP IV N-terminal domain-containing protein, partial [Bacteroidetes bacterium]|nr:DPP IV N-terminal domain-containing protein [Bacteroidota bacterium]
MIRYILLTLFCCPFILFAQEKKQITLEDIFSKNVFRQESVSGFRSMKDGRHYAETSEGILREMKFSDGKVERELVDFKSLEYAGKKIEVGDYAFNIDETKLLLFTESENIYRRSVLHKVYIYDIASKKLSLLRDEKVLHASFSPQSDKVAYVFNNNLYYFDINTNETMQCTNDGSYNIINGNCDWVYEEEFEFTKAYTWSADGSYIAYYRFDQTAVPEYNFAVYDHL